MKKRYILAGALAFYLSWMKGQPEEENAFNVNESEIELVYNQYVQDGDNSAVTGGIGTERLTVYGPSFRFNRKFGSNEISFQLGSDVISSASTDNIDSKISSASRLDTRTYTEISYGKALDDNRLFVKGGLSTSIESDYFSFGKFLGVTAESENKMSTYSASLQIFNDDLRWGRLEGGLFRAPEFLIYPQELRGIDWHEEYKRDTYNLNLGLTRILNEKNTVGAFALVSLQKGLLSTPFHRVFLENGSIVVEQLPDTRLKGAITLRRNNFAWGNIIIRNSINNYLDDFGIYGISLENETAIKLDARWTFIPNFRYYHQQASKYFAPYRQSDPDNEFYTSDYDLSNFNSYSLGLRIGHIPLNKKSGDLRSFTLSYNFYGRSNNLASHTLSLNITVQRDYNRRR